MRTLLCFLFVALSATAFGQLKSVDLKDLGFMAGQWQVQHEWGDMEDVWSAPMDNSMMGSFRCVKDGRVIFYEFMVIEQKDSVPTLHLRHFGPGNIAWEDKEAPGLYPLVLLEKNKAQFRKEDGSTLLTFIRQSPTQLQIVLDSKNGEGAPEKVTFNYTLKQ